MRDEQAFRLQFGRTLEEKRKEKGLTQAQLAEKLNYTDKAVSKWERGESLPDAYTILRAAEALGCPVSVFYNESEDAGGGEPSTEKASPSDYKKNKRRIIGYFVPAIAAVGVVFICSLVYTVLKNIPVTAPYAWYGWLLSLPVTCVVLLVLSFIWWKRLPQFVCLSALIWSVAFTLDFIFTGIRVAAHAKLIYISAALLQIICVLVFFFVRFLHKNKALKK